jgi:hypothetical protein
MPTATLIVLLMASANLTKLNNHFGVFALGGRLISLVLHGKSPSSEVYPNIAHKTARLTSSVRGFLNDQTKQSRMSVLNQTHRINLLPIFGVTDRLMPSQPFITPTPLELNSNKITLAFSLGDFSRRTVTNVSRLHPNDFITSLHIRGLDYFQILAHNVRAETTVTVIHSFYSY